MEIWMFVVGFIILLVVAIWIYAKLSSDIDDDDISLFRHPFIQNNNPWWKDDDDDDGWLW